MKKVVPWIVFFVGALAFAIIVDHGKKHLGIPDYVWLAVNLTAFLYLLYRFVGLPLGGFLDSRRDNIGHELAAAERKLAEAEELHHEVLQRLDQVEQEVAEIRERAEAQGRAEAERIEAQAKAEEERFLTRIEAEISRRGKETRQRLAEETAVLTAQMTRELLEREMTDADRQRVLERSLAALKAVGE